ncbi:extracellular solute-binding protein [Pikeienuella sp. HZG-20]|uniref:extracellular solute-binding protein n=1 Tax=Paludibacillus litoralis TaxID=3133267 RepID=UPI0030EC0CD5
MRITRREFTTTLAAGMAAGAVRPGRARAGDEIRRSHGASLVGALKYPADFTHFDYVNPDAPKGGATRLATQSNFDSFNPFIVKGDSPAGVSLIFDTLMTPSLDQGSTMYGLLAEWIEYPADFSWAAFKLRAGARWHDGAPVTAADVVFSFEALTTKGHPQYRFYYANVTGARDMGEGVVRFDFDKAGNRELPHIMGQLAVLPKHWWTDREFDRSSLEPPLGSGPYRIGSFEPGRFVEYERVEEYWGRDLPVNRGQHNLDRIRYEVFLDADAAFEGFKSGGFDFREENSASKWAQQYSFRAVERGAVKRAEVATTGPKQVQTFAFNLRRPKFGDQRVREAIGLAFDFERTNKVVYFGQYARPTSYFQGTDSLMPSGAPEGAELAMLEPLRGQIPDEVFGPPWTPPKTDGSGRNRAQLKRAERLLKEAGYSVSDGVLRGPDGAPFEIEFLSAQDNQARVILPFIRNLEQLGFRASLRVVDGPQYIRRVAQDDAFDWDMIIWVVANSESPGNEQREFWGSETAMRVGARNVGGVADPAVDALIDRIIFAVDRAELEAACRALDRVLLWRRYMIPQLYTPFERIAWWDRFGHPDPLPPRDPAFPTVWWWDEAKAAGIEEGR